MPKGCRAQWIIELQQYNFTIKYRPEKVNSNADALSRIPEEEIYCFMLEWEYKSDSKNEAECSQKKQKLQNDEPDQYLMIPKEFLLDVLIYRNQIVLKANTLQT